ncbi:MAG TPA: SdrD B-like domain-containing protein, partial [Tepidisphaeraceae bacterium]|nr:SdrD B-like domain-containing protein [Tepidisphaeraceae bacterium]
MTWRSFPNGSVAAVGYTTDASAATHYGVWKWASLGTAYDLFGDPTFNGTGSVLDTGLPLTRVFAQPDGKVVAAGSLLSTSPYSVLVARFAANGAFDSSFGSLASGKWSGNFNGQGMLLSDVDFSTDGDYLAVLTSNTVQQTITEGAIKFGDDGPADTTAPTASIGGPYTLPEGGTVTLDGTASSDVGGSGIGKYEWDFNYDGSTFQADANGAKPVFSAVDRDGPNSATVALRVIDNAGNVSAPAVTTVTWLNVAPTAKFTGSTVTLGSAGTVTFSAPSDPSPADVSAGFQYSYDFNNDGTFDVVDSSSASVAVPASYLTTSGAHAVKGRIKDKDGGSTTYTATVQVNPPASGGSIAGVVFNDANANATKDSGEAGMANVKVYLDANKNGSFDSGEAFTMTGSSGAYTFGNLAAGTYRVREVTPSGSRNTTPSAHYFDATLTAGQNVTGKNFGNTTLVLIAGNVFNDLNASGGKDSGESALASIKIYFDANKNGAWDSTEKYVLSDSAGNWSFNIPAGSYRVRQVLGSGYRISSPTTGYFDITASAGQSFTGRNFADTQKILISGNIFNDANGNGSKDTGETGLGKWTVYADLNNNGKLDAGEANVLSDGSGNWAIKTLAAGTYVIRIVRPTGWSQTKPANNAGQSVTLTSGQTKTGL